MKKLNQQGYNLVELAIAVALLASMAAGVLMVRSYMAKKTVKAVDRTYAQQKAMQMFEELQALVNGNETTGILVLDDYSDGTKYNTVLTTDKLVDTGLTSADPYDPLSGNKKTSSHPRYLRQIQVNRVPNDPWSRQVVVKVWIYGSEAAPGSPGDLLSTVSGYLRTISNVEEPEQVLDVYCIGLSNVLGWFTTIPSMVPSFKSIASDIQTRNPGLQLRTHYITQMGYGRDPYYRPSVNVAADTTVRDALRFVYLYPGLSPQDTSASPPSSNAMFFDNEQLREAGNILQDNAPVDNDYKTSMCDMYNADLRYPEAVSCYSAITATAAAALTALGSAVDPANLPAPTMRMLLEQLNSTTNFKNALMLSMHGEVLPLPNMRNYSDAAKDPANNPYQRVVTHPNLLHSKQGKPVTLRVYDYYDGLIDPSALETSGSTSIGNRVVTQTLYFPSLYFTASDIGVTAVTGGVDNSAVSTAYAYAALTDTTSSYGMSFSLSHPTANVDTVLTLYNTPLRCPPVVSGGVTTGLGQSYQLYSTEYIPCPTTIVSSYTTNANYAPDLTSSVTVSKNTARWIIAINKTAFSPSGIPDGQWAVETRIGNDLTTGTSTGAADQKANLSRTFFWVGSGSNPTLRWGGSGVVPFTERFQYNGDPRHCPYLDVKFGTAAVDSSDTGAVTIEPDSYNWYFRDFNGSNGYAGFSQAVSGYKGYDASRCQDIRDMPRYYYTYRRGLMNNGVIFGNLNGYSFWHASEGGEIGSTYNPWVHSLQFNNVPWDPSASSAAVSIDEIQTSDNWTGARGGAVTGVARGVMRYLSGSTDPLTNWYARTWEGELYPDDWFAATWEPYGNLPTGIYGATNCFWRVPLQEMSTGTSTLDGFDAGRDYEWQIGGRAPAAFMNGRTSSSPTHGFMHTTTGGTANATTLANNTYNVTNYPMDSPLNGSRPWNWDYDISGILPPEWNSAFYSSTTKGIRTTLSVPSIGGVDRIFYDNSGASYNTVGIVKMAITSPSSQSCFFSFSGLAPQGNYDVSALGKITLAMLLRTFLDGGQYSGTDHIAQLPLLKLYTMSPNNQYPYPAAGNYSVALTFTSPVTTTSGAITNIWFRYPGVSSNSANFYTEEYGGYSASAPLTNSTYTESAAASLWVNFKWSTDESHWYFTSDNAPATVGVYDSTTGHGVTYASNAPINYTWDVSDAVTFPQGNYWVRGEAYRPDYPLHYSYHNLEITINR